MKKNEIITLQFGTYSNFVAANYWNLQEFSLNFDQKDSLDPEVIYRYGRNLKGQQTYSPRAIAIDSFSNVRNYTAVRNGAYDDDNDVNLYDLSQDQNRIQWLSNRINILKLSDDLEPVLNSNWANFLYSNYHPRSVMGTSLNDNGQFASFDQGVAEFRHFNQGDQFTDSIRFFAEECDNFQGFQVLTDIYDGFSGLSTRCIQDIYDDYPGKNITVYPLYPSSYKDDDVDANLHLINTIMTYEKLKNYANLIVPLSLSLDGWKRNLKCRLCESINCNPDVWYESSAVLALGLHSLWTPLRNKSEHLTMSDVCNFLNEDPSRKFAVASLELPFNIKSGDYLIDCLVDRCKQTGYLDTSISPFCNSIDIVNVNQMISLCGISEKLLKDFSCSQNPFGWNAFSCETVKEMLSFFYITNTNYSKTATFHHNKSIKIQDLFPNIFKDSLNEFGFVDDSQLNKRLNEVPTLAGLHSGPFVKNGLQSLCADAKKIIIGRYHKYYEGLSRKGYRQHIDNVMDLIDPYC